ncbi:uncharacterized protein JN550_012468 [Neoarthrinium moseri]|uniref:uncharacterized protein n=1 Tax=Neoarthrinium moseri TaxID=1658444 RepID=UPI001FDD2645|nr:uncharacterized protein JN550_012468 [Neoarthrinium moseri]KAI1858718.1 hypothetical protein JN550_012468 [Neoarthrinium moseri]
MSKEVIFRDINPQQKQQLIDRHRQLNRRITRDSLGSFTSSALAIFMPWSLLSVGMNLTNLIRHVHQIRDLQKELASAGIKVQKRVIVQGLIEGAVVKLSTTFLLFGHDDLVLATDFMDDRIAKAGDWIANHSSIIFEAPLPSTQDIILEDEVHRMSHAIIEEASDLASQPTENTQEILGVSSAQQLHEQGISSGWEAPVEQVVQQVVLVGAVQAATEKASDKILEHPVDRTLDSITGRIDAINSAKELPEDNPPALPPRPIPNKI